MHNTAIDLIFVEDFESQCIFVRPPEKKEGNAMVFSLALDPFKSH